MYDPHTRCDAIRLIIGVIDQVEYDLGLDEATKTGSSKKNAAIMAREDAIRFIQCGEFRWMLRVLNHLGMRSCYRRVMRRRMGKKLAILKATLTNPNKCAIITM